MWKMVVFVLILGAMGFGYYKHEQKNDASDAAEVLGDGGEKQVDGSMISKETSDHLNQQVKKPTQ